MLKCASSEFKMAAVIHKNDELVMEKDTQAITSMTKSHSIQLTKAHGKYIVSPLGGNYAPFQISRSLSD